MNPTYVFTSNHNLFRRMTILISCSAIGMRIKLGSSSDWTRVQPVVCSDFRVPVPEFIKVLVHFRILKKSIFFCIFQLLKPLKIFS